jgi:hypothetical protein
MLHASGRRCNARGGIAPVYQRCVGGTLNRARGPGLRAQQAEGGGLPCARMGAACALTQLPLAMHARAAGNASKVR